jgi:hypothetical protein
MTQPHGSWRLFDVPPMFLTIGNASGEARQLSTPHMTAREIHLIGNVIMLDMERRIRERRAAR